MSEAEFHTHAGLTAQTDQVLAEASEILPLHVEEMRQAIEQFGETLAFETRVLSAVQNASPTQVAIMYTRALITLVQNGDDQ